MNERFLMRAIELSEMSLRDLERGPFGCVVVRKGEIVGESTNEVLKLHDPTAHAEVQAIRRASQTLGTHELIDCELYASCEPCPMCLGAILWARIPTVYFAATSADAREAGFDDAAFYGVLRNEGTAAVTREQAQRDEAARVLKAWSKMPARIQY